MRIAGETCRTLAFRNIRSAPSRGRLKAHDAVSDGGSCHSAPDCFDRGIPEAKMTTSQNTFCDVVEVHVAHAVRLICRLIGNCRQDPQTYHVCLPVLPLSGDFRSPQDRLDLV